MKLSRSQDFARPSKNNFELSDRQISKYDKGHTFMNQGYIWYPLYSRSRVQDAKNSYRDLVQATASLPEERKKVSKKSTANRVNIGAVSVLPIDKAADVTPSITNAVIDYKTPDEYRDIQDSFENIL